MRTTIRNLAVRSRKKKAKIHFFFLVYREETRKERNYIYFCMCMCVLVCILIRLRSQLRSEADEKSAVFGLRSSSLIREPGVQKGGWEGGRERKSVDGTDTSQLDG